MKLRSLLLVGAVVASTGLAAQDYSNATGIFRFDDTGDQWKNELTDDNASGEYAAIVDGVFKRDPNSEESKDYNPIPSIEGTDFSIVEGVQGGKAIRVETFSFMYVWHGMGLTDVIDGGGVAGTAVNSYTVMMDVLIPDVAKVYSLFEVNPYTSGGGKSAEIVVREGKVGADYSPFSGLFSDNVVVEASKWHRIAYVCDAKPESGTVKIYVDGVMANSIDYTSVDGSPAAYAAEVDGNLDDYRAAFKIGGNNEGDGFDNSQDIDNLVIFDKALSDAEMAAFSSPSGALGTASFNADNKLKIYPNPTSDFLSIEVIGKSDFKLINSIGQTVISKSIEEKTSVDVRNLKQGLYFVQLQAKDGKISTAKVILK